MKRISFGSRFSIFICAWPLAGTPALVPPRSRLSIASAPVASCDMSNRPSLVSRVTSPADMQHSIASQLARRACKAGSTGRMWSSRNSIVAITMSPAAMASWHAASAPASLPHSSAAWTSTLRPGISRASAASARVTAPLRWLSMVTITTRRLPPCKAWAPGRTAAFMSAAPINGRNALWRHRASPP